MNCISWNVGHLAWQEQRYFVFFAQNKMPLPQSTICLPTALRPAPRRFTRCGSAWETITRAADPWLGDRDDRDTAGAGRYRRPGHVLSFRFAACSA